MRHDKRGMTLVEVIVALALMVLFMGCSIAIIMPVIRVYNKTIAMADDQSIAVNLAETISNKVYYGREIRVSEDKKTLTIDGLSYTVQDGYLMEGDFLLYDTGFYNGATCDIEFNYVNKVVSIDVTIIRENKQNSNYLLDAKPIMYSDEDGTDPGDTYEVGDLAYEDSTGKKVYLSGNWNIAKFNASVAYDAGILLEPGTVYKDHTGVYVILWSCWLTRQEGIDDISLADYNLEANQKIDTNANILTEADYEYSSYYNAIIWINPPVRGSLFLKNGELYVCATPGGVWTTTNVNTTDWVKVKQ